MHAQTGNGGHDLYLLLGDGALTLTLPSACELQAPWALVQLLDT